MAILPFLRPSKSAPLPRVADDVRIYAIGDIHGRFDLLIDLLRRITEDADTRADDRAVRLVFLGDYIDRGDQSARVLDVVSDLSEVPGDGAICLAGNHEDAMMRFLDDPEAGGSWLHFGGLQTLASYGVDDVAQNATAVERRRLADALSVAARGHLDFIASLRSSFRSGDVLFTHAGVNPAREALDQSRDALLWGHVDAQRDTPLPGMLVVHGHYDDARPIERPGRICVDTGAYYSGILTAVRLDQEQGFVSTTP